MKSRFSQVGLPLFAMIVLLLLLVGPNLRMTQAQHPTNEAANAQQTGPNLQFSFVCNGPDLELTMSGDGPFEIQGWGPGLPVSPFAGPLLTLTGPANWVGVRLTELGGDHELIELGVLVCPAPPNRPIVAQAWCGFDNQFQINITSLDAPARLEGNYPGLPMNFPWPTLITMPGSTMYTGLTIRELAGDYETYTLPDISCGIGQYPLQASASCDGTTLQINIPSGDSTFHLINSQGNYRTLYGTGTHLLTDYWPATGIVIRERAGDFESVTLGDIPCNAPTVTPEITPEAPPPPLVLPEYAPARVMQMSAVQPQLVYDQPGGNPIRNPDNSLLMLPQDADGSGGDTFVVLDAQVYKGEVWLGVYLGGPNLGWLPESSLGVMQVTP